jgi:hypothetical protein
MVYNRFSLRQWLTWPRATLDALVRELAARRTLPAAEIQRKTYDANLHGVAAPETVFLSKARLREMFRKFSNVVIRAENSDRLGWRNCQLVSREMMLRFGWLWGLDLYVAARK